MISIPLVRAALYSPVAFTLSLETTAGVVRSYIDRQSGLLVLFKRERLFIDALFYKVQRVGEGVERISTKVFPAPSLALKVCRTQQHNFI